MKRALTLAMFCYLTASFQARAQEAAKPAPSSFPPPQLELRVPFEPTAFPSAGRSYLAYELYFTNFSGQPMTIGRIDVLNAEGSAENPVATPVPAKLQHRVLASGKGVPYVIDSYRAKVGDGPWQKHTSELPLRDVVVEFPRS